MSARGGCVFALFVFAATAGCSAGVDNTPLTPAEKEAVLREYAEAHRPASPLSVPPAGPSSVCASSTKAVRMVARIGRSEGPEGFGTKGCPAGVE